MNDIKFVNDNININTNYLTYNVKQMESLILATEKQMKARSDVLSLLEKHQVCYVLFVSSFRSDALLKLEKEKGNEQKLNLEIAELEEQLKVLKCVNLEEADHENKRKIEIVIVEEERHKRPTKEILLKTRTCYQS